MIKDQRRERGIFLLFRSGSWYIFVLFMFFTYSEHQTTYENLPKTRLILEMIFDLEIEVQGQGCLREFFLLLLTYSVHQTTYKNLLKTWFILEIKFDFELAIFKVKGVCGNFLTIFFIFSAWNYIWITSQTFMTNKTNFLHCTLRCLQGWSIYRPAVRSGTLPEIFSDFMYKFCIL